MGTSNYVQVYKKILATPEGIALIQHVESCIVGAKIVKLSFTLGRAKIGEKEVPDAVPQFHVEVGPKYKFSRRGTIDFSILIENLVEGTDVQSLLDKYWPSDSWGFSSQKVKTFNCSRLIASGKKSHKTVQSFYGWVKDYMNNKFGKLVESVDQSLQVDANRMAEAPDFSELKKAALLKFAIDEISGVMLKYSFLGQEALKAGIDDYIVHEIIES